MAWPLDAVCRVVVLVIFQPFLALVNFGDLCRSLALVNLGDPCMLLFKKRARPD